jgi:hypothetical protein
MPCIWGAVGDDVASLLTLTDSPIQRRSAFHPKKYGYPCSTLLRREVFFLSGDAVDSLGRDLVAMVQKNTSLRHHGFHVSRPQQFASGFAAPLGVLAEQKGQGDKWESVSRDESTSAMPGSTSLFRNWKAGNTRSPPLSRASNCLRSISFRMVSRDTPNNSHTSPVSRTVQQLCVVGQCAPDPANEPLADPSPASQREPAHWSQYPYRQYYIIRQPLRTVINLPLVRAFAFHRRMFGNAPCVAKPNSSARSDLLP